MQENKIEQAIKSFKESLYNDPNQLESQYLIGVCHLTNLDYPKALKEFQALLEKSQTYRINVFLLAAIACKKTNDLQAAVKMLSKAIHHNPQYFDAFIYRGKLFIKLKKFEKALLDFETAINIDSSKPLGYLGKANCLRLMNKYDDALFYYEEAMKKDPTTAKVVLIKKALTNIETKDYKAALNDLNRLIETDPQNSEAQFLKG